MLLLHSFIFRKCFNLVKFNLNYKLFCVWEIESKVLKILNGKDTDIKVITLWKFAGLLKLSAGAGWFGKILIGESWGGKNFSGSREELCKVGTAAFLLGVGTLKTFF